MKKKVAKAQFERLLKELEDRANHNNNNWCDDMRHIIAEYYGKESDLYKGVAKFSFTRMYVNRATPEDLMQAKDTIRRCLANLDTVQPKSWTNIGLLSRTDWFTLFGLMGVIATLTYQIGVGQGKAESQRELARLDSLLKRVSDSLQGTNQDTLPHQ
ncbi:MAG: hypothetical protein JNL70_26585 [Saprospiraceae bacterium]|nr:hypothetical protein [Saprospiraceae bacterium]